LETTTKVLTAKTSHRPVAPNQEIVLTYASLEEAYNAIVLEAYHDHIHAIYIKPRAEAQYKASRQAYEEQQRVYERRILRPDDQYTERHWKMEQEKAQESGRLLRLKLIENREKAAQLEKETESHIRLQVEQQVNSICASLAQNIVQQASISIQGLVEEVKLELWIEDALLNELLSSSKYHLKVCKTFSEIRVQSALNHDRLNQLRHENSNYDLIISQLKREGQHSESIHSLIRFAVNELINLVWDRRILPLLKKEIAEATDTAEQALARQEAINQERLRVEQEWKEKEERRAEQRRQQEQQKQDELRKKQEIEQERKRQKLAQEEEHKVTHYVASPLEVERMLLLRVQKLIPIASVELPIVLRTFAVYDRKGKFYACAIISDGCTLFNFNSAGCVDVRADSKELYAINNLTAIKNSSPLGQRLLLCKNVGDVTSVGGNEVLILNIGGGRFSGTIDWDELRSKSLAERVNPQVALLHKCYRPRGGGRLNVCGAKKWRLNHATKPIEVETIRVEAESKNYLEVQQHLEQDQQGMQDKPIQGQEFSSNAVVEQLKQRRIEQEATETQKQRMLQELRQQEQEARIKREQKLQPSTATNGGCILTAFAVIIGAVLMIKLSMFLLQMIAFSLHI